MTTASSPEMQRRYEDAVKTRVHETPLARSPIVPSIPSLRAHFDSETGRAQTELENPHVEPRLIHEKRKDAVDASILMAIVPRQNEPTVLVTKRSPGISYPGHWVFPGGRADAADANPFETALREAEEEIGIDRRRTEVIGRLGNYYSHSGFRIAPVVALLQPPFEWRPQPSEVEAVEEIPLARITNCSSYFLFRFRDRMERAHFALDFGAFDSDVTEPGQSDRLLTGVTASLCIGLYKELEKTHSHHIEQK